MNILSFICRNGYWVSVSAFVLFVALLIFFIVNVIRVVRHAHVLSVPLLKEQEIEFAEAGRVDLCIEGPQLTTRFAHLTYELSTPYSTNIKGHSALLRTRTSGISQVRMRLETFEIPNPGRYVLQIRGLEENWTPDTKHRLVFTRPYTALLVCYIIGIVLSALFTIGSIVLFSLRITSKGNAS
jgi:hypothetical protein